MNLAGAHCRLDIVESRTQKKNKDVFPINHSNAESASNRAQPRSVDKEGIDTMPPNERIIQRIWLEQRLRRNVLRTFDGRTVTILHPGIWNREAGPDFRQAIIQFNDEPPVTGDVEVDLGQRSWHEHGHDVDPAYRKVILHVVWEPDKPSASGPPTLALCDVLDTPITELIEQFAGNTSGLPPLVQAGACADPLHHLSPAQRVELITQAARRRLNAKAKTIQARARHVGWEQALWEGLFAALGYKHNVWPMRRLAELLPLLSRIGSGSDAAFLTWQSRLLGLGGLLPADFSRLSPDSRAYIRRLWDEWWREQAALAPYLLPSSLWHMHGLRPANQPARRLALAASWLSTPGWIHRLDGWIAEEIPDRKLLESLCARISARPDGFWAWHWTFRSKRSTKSHPLIGAPRLTDLAMNVLLPWFWSRAEAGRNRALRELIEHRYFAWPAGEDNAVLKLVRQRLMGDETLQLPRTAAIQQGLIQLARDYCDQSNVLCEECELPDLLRAMGKTDPPLASE